MREAVGNTLKAMMGGFGLGIVATFYGIYFGASIIVEYILAKVMCDATLKKAAIVTVILVLASFLQGVVTSLLFPPSDKMTEEEAANLVPIWYGLLSLVLVIYLNIAVRKHHYESGAFRNLVIGFLTYVLAGIGAALLLFFLIVSTFSVEAKRQLAEASQRLEAANRVASEMDSLRPQIDAAYQALTEKRKTLDPKDPKAVEAFNVEAARYHEMQKRYRELQSAPAPFSTPAAPPSAPGSLAPAPQ